MSINLHQPNPSSHPSTPETENPWPRPNKWEVFHFSPLCLYSGLPFVPGGWGGGACGALWISSSWHRSAVSLFLPPGFRTLQLGCSTRQHCSVCSEVQPLKHKHAHGKLPWHSQHVRVSPMSQFHLQRFHWVQGLLLCDQLPLSRLPKGGLQLLRKLERLKEIKTDSYGSPNSDHGWRREDRPGEQSVQKGGQPCPLKLGEARSPACSGCWGPGGSGPLWPCGCATSALCSEQHRPRSNSTVSSSPAGAGVDAAWEPHSCHRCVWRKGSFTAAQAPLLPDSGIPWPHHRGLRGSPCSHSLSPET